MFVKLVLLITFLVHFLKTFSTDLKSAFDFLGHISTVLFSNFEAKRAKNGAKNQKHPSKGLCS
jgi:hypothetical protein